MPAERRGQVIAVEIGSTGNGRSLTLNGRRQPSCGGTSRMTRECQVRICEGLEVKFLGPTRRKSDSATTWRAPPRAEEFRQGHERMDRQEEQIAHELETILPVNLHKTAPRFCQFATHTKQWPVSPR
jgi:hypothetical protein